MPVFDTDTSNVMCNTMVPWSRVRHGTNVICAIFLYAENQNLKMLFNMKN